jgi:hypothetical protein
MTESVDTSVLLAYLSDKLSYPIMPSFNRLEGRPRSNNFDQALRAEVRDPLWMLCKQWQMGEFKGDDAGSPVSAKMCMKQTRLTKYKAANGSVEAFNDSLPLETKVEQRPVPFAAGDVELALDLRLMLGRHWRKLLLKAGFSQALVADYIEQFHTVSPDPDLREHVYYCGNKQSWQQLKASAHRHVDGKKLYDHIISDETMHPVSVGADPGDHAALIELGRKFVRWYHTVIIQPQSGAGSEAGTGSSDTNDAWLANQLEYQFFCSAPKPQGEQVYAAREYFHGHLDWYNLSIQDSQEGLGEVEFPNVPEGLNENIVRSFIPTPVKFDGMPNTRWWAFEEGKTNFGDINPDTTDINKLLLMEFGLVYANDWFLVPVTVPAGSIVNIHGLSVKNVFGENLWVTPTGSGLDDDPDRWTMYSLDIEGEQRKLSDLSLVIMPSVPKIHEGKSLEEVHFTRDEMANMVWGMETRVPSPVGKGIPGREAARDTVNFIKRMIGEAANPEEVAPQANLRYKVMSSVPENWIPFISTHVDGSFRSVQLQRGAMPRIIEGDNAPIEKVRPRSNLLRTGLNQNPKQAYYLHEEEVPRSGISVKQSFQRTRWYNGEVFTWVGVRKSTGQGESASQLKFDYLQPVKNNLS